MQTPVYLATVPELEGVTGEYFANERVERASPPSRDAEAARRLWEVGASLAGVRKTPAAQW